MPIWILLCIVVVLLYFSFSIGQLVGIHKFQKWADVWMKDAIKLIVEEMRVQKIVKEIIRDEEG